MTLVRVASDRALLVEMPNLDAAMRMHAALEAAHITGVRELIPAAQTILVHFEPEEVSAELLSAELTAVEPVPSLDASERSVTVPVRYDGADLTEVAALLDMSVDGLIERHLATVWRVAFTGFAPGFGYLVGNDPLFRVPRRSSPRTRIPAGSLALAGEFTGIYPRESPGGWQLIGTTNEVMWDLDREPPAIFTPGTTVNFALAERQRIETSRSPVSRGSSTGDVEIVSPGLQLLLQDAGRAGWAALGVAASGVADRGASNRANAAVGNAMSAAVLEHAGGGARIRIHAPTVCAVSGAAAQLTVRTASAEFGVARDQPFALEQGDELRIGGATEGLRTVIAMRGGFVAPVVLGSLATDTLAGLGPAPLAAGDRIDLGAPQRGVPVEPSIVPPPALPAVGDVVQLRIVLGPRDDWLSRDGLQTLLSQDWLVSPRSDRVGIRLAGETPLERKSGELPSEGAVTGAIQVPPDGQPVVFLQDHPLTGGYPIAGAVVDRDLDVLGQVPPGARIRFVVEEIK